jgi:hypothetical protein
MSDPVGPASSPARARNVGIALAILAVAAVAFYLAGSEPKGTAPVPADGGKPPAEPAPVAKTEAKAPQVAWRLPERTAKTPNPSPKVPELVDARKKLAAVVDANAKDPENPWAIKHAMLVYGTDFELTNGKGSVDWLLSEYAEEVEIGGEKLVTFPEKRDVPGATEDIRIEPHTDLLLKAMAMGGEKPDRVVTVEEHPHPMGDLYRASLYETWIDGNQLWTTSWNDTPWTLAGLAAWGPDQLAWTARGGHAMDMDALTHALVLKLHDEMKFVRELKAAGKPVEKTNPKKGVHNYTCGGLHLVHAVGYAIARGYGSEDDKAMFLEDLDATFYRFAGETAQLDAITKTPGRSASDLAQLFTQRLKFSGHLVEVGTELAAMGVYTPTVEQQDVMNKAAGQIVVATTVMEKLGLFEALPKMKGGPNHQLYLDVVGDAAHAVHALDLHMGDDTVSW